MFILFSLFAGAAIAMQAALNAHLGQLLNSAPLATLFLFCSGLAYTSLMVYWFVPEFPSISLLRSIPLYLWIWGGLLSTVAIGMFYYLIPKMGVASMLSYSLSGQLLFGMVASHYGWFHLPVSPLSPMKVGGFFAMITGLFMINRGGL